MESVALLFTHGKYQQADSLLLTIDSRQPLWNIWKQKIDTALQLVQHPILCHPDVMAINDTQEDTYWPAISPDGTLLAVTDSHRGTTDEAGSEEDVRFFKKKSTGNWIRDMLPEKFINTPANEGSVCFSVDGRYLFFVASDRSDGLGSCDIYYLIRHGNGWSFPMHPESPLNTRFWESNPSLSSDGRMLYFCSNRPGGIGGMDIWSCRVQPQADGTLLFYDAKNLGRPVNTPQNEFSPFIHPDNRTLYFSSDGHPGLGGEDIFLTHRSQSGKWTEPRNIGYPINSPGDDEGFTTDAQGIMGYYSSNAFESDSTFSRQQIYQVKLPVTDRPAPMKCTQGNILPSALAIPTPNVVQVINLKTDRVVFNTLADRYTGNFTICYPDTGRYALSIVKEGYLFHFSLLNDSVPTANIPLAKIAVGEKVALQNIYFEFNSANLQPASTAELNQLGMLLENNPSMHLLIAGYTDSIGSKSYNIQLSLQRAEAVVSYLVSHGISSDRLQTKGYGSTYAVGNNETAQGRALNRRTEAIVIHE
ncbi:OmpA family protein [Microbacter margulisiae]|uniref:Outer membrane protein OmpA-like peptidoglycan-associated protein n=1 Tax=Microbacter margulisiae TaxID=1350067 RepID=A0A7W5H2M3_9PORP|nr:OmpA family protein [Microbacter margulisiae]MBB3187910.1 outer membrane protein OmpA-like peptidoglycan-associated protein [Microbacter margulisiae]